MKKLIGIDVGFANTGVVIMNAPDLIIETVKVITTEKDENKRSMRVADQRIQRIQYIIREISSLLIEETLVKGHNVFVAVEAPHGGAQSGNAMRDMAAALSIIVTILYMMDLPTDFLSPSEVKLIATGKKTGSKDEIIKAMCKRFSITETSKVVTITKGKRKGKESVQKTFKINDVSLAGGKFEHVADAIAACCWCSEHSPFYNAFIKS